MRQSSLLLRAPVLILLLVCLYSGAVAERKNWVLLVAGSKGYENYRHQADVCHAYHIAHDNGIPDEQVVVMMNDDIADDPMNPVQGNLINRPGGPNVYPGVPKDYTGEDVTAETFLKVLQGDADGIENQLGRKGKVIDSGPEDHIFVFYSDHGAPACLGMPHGGRMTARPLMNALQKMHDEKKFAKLVFYVEACEAGSTFEDRLPEDINVYVTTASNYYQSSYACYCETDRGTCLGDLYAVSWMENADAVDLSNETLQQQYEIVKTLTNKSHVMQYGDTSFTSLTLDKFLTSNNKTCVNHHETGKQEQQTRATFPGGEVPTDMVGIHTLERLLVSPHPRHVARRAEIARNLQAEIWTRDQTAKVLADVAGRVFPGQDVAWTLEQRARIESWDCYDRAADRLIELCPGLDPSENNFIMRRLSVLVNLCNSRPEGVVMKALESAIADHPICY